MPSHSELKPGQASEITQPLETEDIAPIIDIPSIPLISDQDLETIETEIVTPTYDKAIVSVVDNNSQSLIATIFDESHKPVGTIVYEQEIGSQGILRVGNNDKGIFYSAEDGELTFNFSIAEPLSVSLTIIPSSQLLAAVFPTFEGAEATYLLTGNVFTTDENAPEDDGSDHLEVVLADKGAEVVIKVLSQDSSIEDITKEDLLKFFADYKKQLPTLDHVMRKLQQLRDLKLVR